MTDRPYHDEDKLRSAYQQLGSQKEVADEFGCHETTIVKWMKKHGIEAQREYESHEVQCKNCDSTLERPPWRLEKRENHFCDYECHSEWQKEANLGENNNNWKPPAEKECEQCGTQFQFERKYRGERRFCSLDCANRWKSQSMRGEDHHNWTGQDHYTYYGANWKDQREKVVSRDVICRICEHDGSEHRLEVHHITPIKSFDDPEDANTLDNLILLCRSCHGKVEAGEIDCPKPTTNNE